MKLTNGDIELSLHFKEFIQLIDDSIMQIVGDKRGFCLVVFNLEDKGYSQYGSNCDRDEVMRALKGLIELWEQGIPDIPAHERQ